MQRGKVLVGLAVTMQCLTLAWGTDIYVAPTNVGEEAEAVQDLTAGELAIPETGVFLTDEGPMVPWEVGSNFAIIPGNLVNVQPVVRQTASGLEFSSGAPPASDPSVARFSTFVVELWAQQALVDPTLNGLACVFTDLTFDTAPLTCVSAAASANYFFFFTGTCDNALGLVNELGGCSLTAGLGITPGWVRIASVSMTADVQTNALTIGSGAASTTISIVPGMTGGGGNVPPGQVNFLTSSAFCISISATDSTCDGIDDDCDGVVDDNYVINNTCGTGYCETTNTPSSCIGGVETLCVPGTPLSPNDAVCDGIDADCDGLTDENYVIDGSCGVGHCLATNIDSSCVNGVETLCQPGAPLSATDATCNGVDDNCNGTVDENYVAPATACGLGVCASTGVLSCVSGATVNTCVAGSPTGTDNNCNALDENCNGTINENYVAPATACGLGVCASTGVLSCVSGATVNTCVAGSPTGTDNNCNALDENCNGTINENYVAPATACGLGVCASTGVLSCVSGATVNTCVAGSPTGPDDNCNGINENCNATTDENYVAPATACGVGVCASTGVLSCVSGATVNTCVAGSPTGTDNNCNALDENCNGTINENYVVPATACGLGVCASTGLLTCVSGATVDTCVAGSPTGPDDNCNGINENCNATTDENYVAPATACGVGVCASTGVLSCVGGATVNTCVAGSPTGTDSNCNALDENCNGTINENYVAPATACGVGVCASTGVLSCVSGATVNTCVAGSPTGTDSNCNGLDDNCNGPVDEFYVPPATACGLGVCASTGLLTCVSGATVNTCVVGSPTGTDSNCNGINENCNATTDENYVAPVTACGVGACTSTGFLTCVSGATVNTCVVGSPTGTDNNCNGVDENCSGAADENYVAPATACGVGACASTGVLSCVSGATVNTCTPGSPGALDNNCNGLDENCSGTADEAYIAPGTTCGLGVCASTGLLTCVSGATVDTCVAGSTTGTDNDCNALDENCNGTINENYVPPATACGLGVCASTGLLTCVSGATVDTCVAGSPTGTDSNCNALDENCNGTANENYVAPATACGVGMCASTGVLSCVSGATVDTCAPGTPAAEVCDGLDHDCDGNLCGPPAGPGTPMDTRKNRYISFAPDNGPTVVAFQVNKSTAPMGTCWVAAPDAQGLANCVAAPVYRVWPESVVHVGDCEIVPVAQYGIRTTTDAVVFTPPLMVNTIALPVLNNKKWGDVSGQFTGSWPAPDLFTNVNDLVAVLAYINNTPTKPHITVVNISDSSSGSSCVPPSVNTGDVQSSVFAIANKSYGPPDFPLRPIDPALCPVCP